MTRRDLILPLLALIAVVCAPAPARADACAPIPPGLVGWWKLDGNGLDETGNHNGGAVGSGSFVPGLVGAGYRSNAANNAVLVPHDAGLNVTNFTVDAWVYLDAIPCYNMPVAWKGTASGADITTPFSIGIYGTCERPSLTGQPFIILSDGTLEQEVDAPTAIPVGTWTHLAATADGTTFTIYVNGVAVNSTAQTMAPQFNTQPLVFGGLVGAGAVNYIDGIVDEVELHSQAATAAQIAAIWAAGSVGKCPIITPAHEASWGSVKAIYR